MLAMDVMDRDAKVNELVEKKDEDSVDAADLKHRPRYWKVTDEEVTKGGYPRTNTLRGFPKESKRRGASREAGREG